MPEVFSLASDEERPSERVVLVGERFAAQFCRPQRENNLWHPAEGTQGRHEVTAGLKL